MGDDFKHFTAFRSAAEEAASAPGSGRVRWENEGGSVQARAGRVVVTKGSAQPYKVILEHDAGPCTEHPCDSVREGEAMIRDHRGRRPSAADKLPRT